jgi:hypothetical protein
MAVKGFGVKNAFEELQRCAHSQSLGCLTRDG